jgi:hypothetical protein
MNNAFVQARLQFSGATPSQLIFQNLTRNNPDLINTLYLNILSRLPSTDEMAKAQATLPTTAGTPRNQAVQDLVWSLYNKVDFVFNY